MMFTVLVFLISHLIGVNVHDPEISRLVLMFNLSNIFIFLFFFHTTLSLIGILEKQRKILNITYVLSFILLFIYIIFPDTFLLPSVPKLYFTNYYVAGSLHWIMRLFSGNIIPAYFLYQTILVYRKSDPSTKNRLRYFFVASFLGVLLGTTAEPLIYNITFIDPIWSIFFVTAFFIPFTYAIIQYELLDIIVIAKKAIYYAFYVVIGGISIEVLFFLNNLAEKNIQNFPLWLFPMIWSIIIVTIGIYIWNKLRETDQLKYNFISIITHKFRTPLTYIKWASDSLLTEVPEANKEDIKRIKESNHKLIELIDILANLSDTESSSFNYKAKSFDIYDLVSKHLAEHQHSADYKKIKIEFTGDLGSFIFGDETRINSAIEIIIDNSINYTPEGGKITIKVNNDKYIVTVQIIDNGMGLNKEEKEHLFTKFYRSSRAQMVDTEGVGVGLFMVRQIIEKDKGKINIYSEGENKGMTFTIVFPYKK